MARNSDNPEVVYMSLSGTRAQSVQRLQIGLAGLGAMALLVGLATIIMDRARQTDASSVPEAVTATAANPSPAVNDPLADAGVAPEVAPPKPQGLAGDHRPEPHSSAARAIASPGKSRAGVETD